MTRVDDQVDVLVIGSGIAGLSYALYVAGPARVRVVTKKARATSNTNYARGGIAAVMGDDDDPALHLRDTLICGAGLCRRRAVEILVREGPERIRDLLARGVPFAREESGLRLGMEGGHSRRRIVHSGDRTGYAIESALLDRAAEHPFIEILDDHFVEDFLLAGEGGRARCAGARVVDETTGDRTHVGARVTLLASGGIGRIYRFTTNPPIATGDGVAMAYRAGAPVGNMEFVQFHPTALYPPEDPAFLISEALRGEGGVLRLRDGSPFMDRYDPRGSLAPRDIVARAIHSELRRTGDESVILDLGAMAPEEAEERFPSTLAGCRERGLQPLRDGIPVVPAAHYGCGGVSVDADAASGLPGLLAVGEVAHTGVHGANRLASNSLLEAVVFAHRAAIRTLQLLEEIDPDEVPVKLPAPLDPKRGELAEDGGETLAAAMRSEGLEPLRQRMWDHAGIVRRLDELQMVEGEISGALRILQVDPEGAVDGPTAVSRAETRNALLTALIVVRSALARRESRGLHYLEDHPWRDNERFLRDTIIARPGTGRP